MRRCIVLSWWRRYANSAPRCDVYCARELTPSQVRAFRCMGMGVVVL